MDYYIYIELIYSNSMIFIKDYATIKRFKRIPQQMEFKKQ